jgi:hypothetical protein
LLTIVLIGKGDPNALQMPVHQSAEVLFCAASNFWIEPVPSAMVSEYVGIWSSADTSPNPADIAYQCAPMSLDAYLLSEIDRP